MSTVPSSKLSSTVTVVLFSLASINHGPCQFREKVIPVIISNEFDDKPLPVYGDGRTSKIIEQGDEGEVYNIWR